MQRRTAKGITIQTLRGVSNNDIVKCIIEDAIRIIDAKITTAHSAGHSSISYELPNNFGINNLDKADAQILIYSELLSIYKNPIDTGGKGFTNTTIEIGPVSFLYVSWNNGMTDAERESRKQLLKANVR